MLIGRVRLIVSLLLVLSGVFMFYIFDNSIIYARVGYIFLGIFLALIVFWKTSYMDSFLKYFRGAVDEAKKVVWPTKKETLQTTVAVFVFVVLVAIYLWLVDKGLGWLIYDVFLGWRGD